MRTDCKTKRHKLSPEKYNIGAVCTEEREGEVGLFSWPIWSL